MKKKIIGLLLILAIMASIPTVLNNKKLFNNKTANNKPKTQNENIITQAASYCFRKHYHPETLKAIILILNSNYRVNKLNKKELINKNDFIKKFKNGKDYYSNIEKTVNKLKEEYVTYNNNPIYIPYFRISKGYTEKNKKYPYLNAVACPWDKIKKEYKASDNTVGISINSLDKLCSNGMSYKEAIGYFLYCE